MLYNICYALISIKIESKNAIPIQNNKDLNSGSAPRASEHAEGYFLTDTQWWREQKIFPCKSS